MKGRLLIKIAGIAGAVALLAGATFAVFTSNYVTITGVSVASATPSLKVWDGGGWVDTVNLGITETHMYPGWTGDPHTFRLGNLTGGGVPFGQIIADIVSGSGVEDWDTLKDVVKMQFVDVDSGLTSGPQTLAWWNANPYNILGAIQFGDNTGRNFEVEFSMDPSADDTAQGQTLSFTLGFVGQTP